MNRCIRFNRTGLGDIWLLDGSLHNTECIKDRLQLRLHDILKQEWLVATCSNRICTNYTIFMCYVTQWVMGGGGGDTRISLMKVYEPSVMKASTGIQCILSRLY